MYKGQEVHGLEGEIYSLLRNWFPGWYISVSSVRNPDGSQRPAAGGVATLVCPEILNFASFASLALIPVS